MEDVVVNGNLGLLITGQMDGIGANGGESAVGDFDLITPIEQPDTMEAAVEDTIVDFQTFYPASAHKLNIGTAGTAACIVAVEQAVLDGNILTVEK